MFTKSTFICYKSHMRFPIQLALFGDSHYNGGILARTQSA